MTNPIEIINCDDDDIFSFQDETCKFSKFRQAVQGCFHSNLKNYISYISEQLKISQLNIYDHKLRKIYNENWLTEGKECEVLKPYKGWQKGKLRIKLSIEFIPDEPEPIEENGNHETNDSNESPLDEIRQQLTTKN